ncbi:MULTISPECIES: zinc-binding alcohol dehydrogenase family protein [unclassified Curtobacterium]|uniref:zinc-binding alcohol dehydrogenase family protein n=1 Tax=unclassified Curtobacterium TaxID=257496 RepID=UPI0008DCEF81|nr:MULTISPECIES: zinc-binding alcohol dehydrogenase family protein [unclassified Curtobacterium]MDR6574828.1 zinc-binding alcohol dehydrogenase family protein [Curtobacterium sp. 320]OII24282.1 NADPH:quinone reductase [Curtobacterium sp. MCBA15_016]
MTTTNEVRAIGQTAALPVTSARSLVPTTIPEPVPGPHDLLVEVRAVSVNPVDVKLRGGAEPDGGVRVLGFDASGTVRAVGDAVTLFAPGDDVFYAGAIDRPGSNAELQVVDERIVGRRPRTLSHTEAAALPLTAITAWESLFEKLRIGADATGTLLVVGGAGGVGSMAIQLARTLLPGVRVIATASRPASESWVRDLGAHDVVDHHADLAAQVLEVAPDGIEWILTTNSAGQLPVYERVLRPFGEIVAIDDPEQVDVVALKSKALSWHWEFMFARSLHQATDMHRQHELLDTVADLVDAGRVRHTATTVLRPISAETLREAHALVESGRVIGKVVVTDEPAL